MTYHTVYIVGAGPGDPELLTLKAHRLITDYAELVVYDRLIYPELLALIPPHVEDVYAGKSCKKHHMTQEEINATLVTEAKKGKKIVRLKGGDPFIFGRGGEEIEHLAQHNIPYEVVPGISAAAGISSYLGLPLTHRGLATGVQFITGHQQKGAPIQHDWNSLANPDTTLVVYMGLANIGAIAENLIAAGLPNTTPAVAIQDGTTEREKKCFAPLSELTTALAQHDFEPPTLIFIGHTVGFAEELYNTQNR